MLDDAETQKRIHGTVKTRWIESSLEKLSSPLRHLIYLHTLQEQFSLSFYHQFVSFSAQLPHSPPYFCFYLPPSPSHVLLLSTSFLFQLLD